MWALQCPFLVRNQRAWEPVAEVLLDQFPGVQSRKRKERAVGLGAENLLLMKMVKKNDDNSMMVLLLMVVVIGMMMVALTMCLWRDGGDVSASDNDVVAGDVGMVVMAVMVAVMVRILVMMAVITW